MKTELKYGLITGLLGMAWLYLEFVIGLHDQYIELHPVVTLFSLLIPLITIVLAIKEKRNKFSDRILTYWERALTGFGVSLIAALINIGTQFLYTEIINPEWLGFMVEMTKTKAQERFKDPVEVQEQISAANQYFSQRNYLLQSFFAPLLLGTFISVIAAIFISGSKK